METSRCVCEIDKTKTIFNVTTRVGLEIEEQILIRTEILKLSSRFLIN